MRKFLIILFLLLIPHLAFASWTYTASTDTLTQDASTTNDWHSAWTADKAGTLTVKTATTTTANTSYTLTTDLRPADDLALPVTIVVSAKTNTTNVTFVITGVDNFGSAVSSTLTITGAGSFTTTGVSFASINTSGIAVSATWDGNCVWTMTQPRWGRFWQTRQTGYSLTTEQQYNKQFYCNATNFVGDGTITDANSTTTNEGFDLVLACTNVSVTGTWNFGYLNKSQPRAGWKLITLQSTDLFHFSGTLNFTAGTIIANSRWLENTNGTYNFNWVFFQGADGIEASTIGNLTDVRWTQASGVGFKCFGTPTTATRVSMVGNVYGIQVVNNNSQPVFSDPIFANNTTSDIIMNTGATNRILTLIDPKDTTGTYITRPTTSQICMSSSLIYVKFRFDLNIKDEAGNNLEGANWILSNASYSYSGTTDANGDITQQNVISQVNVGDASCTPGTWTDYSSYTLLIYTSGYMNYFGYVSVNARKGMNISLRKVKTLNFSKTTKVLF